MEILKKIWTFLVHHRDIIYILVIVIISLLMTQQCGRKSTLIREVQRLENNIYAVQDSLSQYMDENGRIIAEKHAFQMTEKELRDSVELLKKKNREYIAYINAHISIRDTVRVPVYIDRTDTVLYADAGTVSFDDYTKFGKSKRELHVRMPYTVTDGRLSTQHADVDMYHDIFVEGTLERDVKTKETYVRLVSDYPDLSFNSGMGVLVTNSKSYENSIRKTRGIGICIGPGIGVGYDMINEKLVPTVGLNVTIGFTYTPRWTQW